MRWGSNLECQIEGVCNKGWSEGGDDDLKGNSRRDIFGVKAMNSILNMLDLKCLL